MTASNIDRLATAHVALTNRLLSDSYWYEDFMTGVAILLALAAQSFAEDFILCDLAADSDAARKDAK